MSLAKRLDPIIRPPGFTGRAPGGPSRFRKGPAPPWFPVEPRVVVEVCFDHASNGRFRHGTRFLRLRPDKAPRQCGVEQMSIARRA